MLCWILLTKYDKLNMSGWRWRFFCDVSLSSFFSGYFKCWSGMYSRICVYAYKRYDLIGWLLTFNSEVVMATFHYKAKNKLHSPRVVEAFLSLASWNFILDWRLLLFPVCGESECVSKSFFCLISTIFMLRNLSLQFSLIIFQTLSNPPKNDQMVINHENWGTARIFVSMSVATVSQ